MEKSRLTFLGTGTSQGIPIIGCTCEVCRSADSADKRFRSSAFVEYAGRRILVDAGPDFRMQMLAHGLHNLDGILLTHNHKDHTGGLDDVRSLNYIDRRATEIYCERNVLEDLIREYPYVFRFPKYPGAPEWQLNVIDERPFLLRDDLRGKELVWVHDKGYHFRLPDGTLVPTGAKIEDIVHEAPRPEGDPAPEVTLSFPSPVTFNRVVLQEYIPLGQRIASFRVEAQDEAGEWNALASGTTVGCKRILLTPRTTVRALRLRIDASLATPLLSGLSLYDDRIYAE